MQNALSLRPQFLRGEHIYLRPMLASDKDVATAWHPGPYPINSVRAKELLEEAHRVVWINPHHRYAIVRKETDEVVGSVAEASHNMRTATVSFTMAPWLPDADALRAEALRLFVAWLRDERELMVVRAGIAADEPQTIAAAEQLGMVLGVCLREHIARADARVDQLVYEALNPRWEVQNA